MKVFIMAPKSTAASEKAKRPGDNALYVIIRELKLFGFDIIGAEVARLPTDKPIPLDRRAAAISHHREAQVTLIMGSDTERDIRSWFPISEAIRVPQPFFYINEPGRIKIELVEKINDFTATLTEVFGFDTANNLIGGAPCEQR
jgi:hypothetical protein